MRINKWHGVAIIALIWGGMMLWDTAQKQEQPGLAWKEFAMLTALQGTYIAGCGPLPVTIAPNIAKVTNELALQTATEELGKAQKATIHFSDKFEKEFDCADMLAALSAVAMEP